MGHQEVAPYYVEAAPRCLAGPHSLQNLSELAELLAVCGPVARPLRLDGTLVVPLRFGSEIL
jgi:hypothetical protein